MRKHYHYYHGDSSASFNGEEAGDFFKSIDATDLRDFAKSLGWLLIPQALNDGLYVLNNPDFPRRQLVFPVDNDAADYSDSVRLTIHKLADMQQQPLHMLLLSLEQLKDDVLKFRIQDARQEERSLPLSYAANAVNGAKEMLLSAACTVLRPQYHHPRLNRTEALTLVDKARFGHTEKGSFVLNVSTPVKAIETQGDLYAEEHVPFVRQSTLVINRALSALVTSIQSDTLDALVEEMKSAQQPVLSSNICKAITNFQEEHNDFDLSVGFHWATGISLPSQIKIPAVIKIQRDYFSRIDDVRKELRSGEQNREDTFMSSVEVLNGEFDPATGARSGEVILNLYHESEIIRARANLNAPEYTQAHKAHMIPGSYIKIKGILHSGKQPRSLSDIALFELILP